MSAFYDEMAAMSLELINEFGKPLPVYRLTKTIDAVTGASSAIVAIGEKAPTCIFRFSSGDLSKYARYFERASVVLGDMRKALVALWGMTNEPAIGDLFKYEGNWYRVALVDPLNVEGTPLVSTLVIEKASVTPDEETALNLVTI